MANLISQKFKVSPCFPIKALEYNVCGIKLEMKVMLLHKIHVEYSSSFPLNKYAVHDF